MTIGKTIDKLERRLTPGETGDLSKNSMEIPNQEIVVFLALLAQSEEHPTVKRKQYCNREVERSKLSRSVSRWVRL